MQENGRLGHLSLAQVLVSTFKHDIRNLELEDVVGFLEHVLGFRELVVQVLAHPYKLGTLARKNICFDHLYIKNLKI